MEQQYLVDLHTHTVASSHAYSTIGEYIREAQKKGIKIIACTDHGCELTDGASHHWHFENLHCVPSFVDDVIVLKGIEANIRTDGTTDCYDRYKGSFDIVLAGFHAPVYPKDKSLIQNTEVLMQVISSGKIDVITHPAHINYPIDIHKVAKCAAEHNVALEINCSKFSRIGPKYDDMCAEIIQESVMCKTPLVFGSDSHIHFNLGDFSSGIALMNRVGCPTDYVLNSSPKKVLEFLISRGHRNLEALLKYC